MDPYARRDRQPIALLYCHDTFGLGHLRRTLAVVGELRRRCPELSALVATGSPLAHRFRLPEGVDFLKLPAVAKRGDGRYASRTLALGLDEIVALRRELLLTASRHVAPQLVVVDNVPGGLGGELLSALEELGRIGNARLVLGLRDVVDESSRVRRAWTRDGSYALLDDVFHRILVYGEEDVFDAVSEYGFSSAAAGKTRYVGYMGRGAGGAREAGTPPRVLVTVGGGEDGEPLLRAALAACSHMPPGAARWLFVTGPFLPAERRAALAADAARLPGTDLVEFVDDLPAAIAASAVIVSMGGYNTVCEILSADRPAVLVPRVEPRLEQLVRARALERRGLVRVLAPDRLAPGALARELEALLGHETGRGRPVDLGGLERTGDELMELLDGGSSAAAGAGKR